MRDKPSDCHRDCARSPGRVPKSVVGAPLGHPFTVRPFGGAASITSKLLGICPARRSGGSAGEKIRVARHFLRRIRRGTRNTASVKESRDALDADFRAFFNAHAEYVMKSLRRLGVRPGDVDDLTHEVFLAVLRKWSSYDPARPPRPWLFAFAMRMASGYRNSAYIRRESFEDPGLSHAVNPERLFAEREASSLVYRALDTLDLDKRIVFTMFELDERTAADIATELGISQNTVFSRLRAAREAFTRAVQRLSREPAQRMSSLLERAHVQ